MQDGPSPAHALALVALDLGTLPGADMLTLVSGCVYMSAEVSAEVVWSMILVALDLGTLLGAGMVTLVSGCRNRLELEQEAEGDPGYTGCPGNVAAFLPSQAVRRMRMKGEGR